MAPGEYTNITQTDDDGATSSQRIAPEWLAGDLGTVTFVHFGWDFQF
jgi:hypothetical protein